MAMERIAKRVARVGSRESLGQVKRRLAFPGSVDFLDLSDNLLLEERQHGGVVFDFLKHHTALELVARFFKIISGEWERKINCC